MEMVFPDGIDLLKIAQEWNGMKHDKEAKVLNPNLTKHLWDVMDK